MMWDKRYDSTDYVYGTEPNDFLRENVQSLPKGRLLTLAEGEGRNAVYLAELGHEVTAVDSSSVGLRKAKQLADKARVNINFIHADLAEFDIGQSKWDSIVSIFCPLPPALREPLHRQIVKGLTDNGVFLLEAYRPEQAYRDTGGGNDTALMQTKTSLLKELQGLHFTHLEELERTIVEGRFHTGVGSVVQAIAQKLT